MKEELQQIANKHDMELREVVEVAKELIDKIEEEMAEFEVGDTVMTPDGIGVIKHIQDKIIRMNFDKSCETFWQYGAKRQTNFNWR